MIPQEGQNPLAGLRDIHMPAEQLPLWPPAMGWWLAVLVLVCGVLLVRFYLAMRRKSLRKNALGELEKLHTDISKMSAPELAENISGLLKRVAISRYGRTKVAGLFGREWVDFLQNKNNHPLGDDIAEFLINAPYRDHQGTIDTAFANRLTDASKNWIRQNT